MKKTRLIALLLTLIIAVTASGCHKGEKNPNGAATDTNASSDDETNNGGAKTQSQLIADAVKCINNGGDINDIIQEFDFIGTVAYVLMDNNGEINMKEAYDAIQDFNEGADYVVIKHESFAQKWEEYNKKPFSDDDINTYTPGLELLEGQYTEWLKELNATYAPLDDTFDADRVWESDYGYYNYRIDVESETVTSLNIKFMERDGLYYIIYINEAA